MFVWWEERWEGDRHLQQGSGQLKCCTAGLEHEYRLQHRKVARPRGSSRPKPQQHLIFVIAHLSCFKSPNVWLYLSNKTATVNICPWRTSQTVTSRREFTPVSLRDTLPWARLLSSSFSLNSRVSVSLHRHGKGQGVLVRVSHCPSHSKAPHISCHTLQEGRIGRDWV